MVCCFSMFTSFIATSSLSLPLPRPMCVSPCALARSSSTAIMPFTYYLQEREKQNPLHKNSNNPVCPMLLLLAILRRGLLWVCVCG